uniref:Uncharacterized protein n=1 Tax=Hordeum vulgare subsp. vulgare TaxID=112509 RepID=A0A8I6WYN8_HORVV
MARAAIQTTLELRKTNGTSSVPTMSPSIDYDQGIIKELIAKMICVHEYSFRMVEHEWFNILMKCMNPNYKSIGRKAIRAECLRVYKKEKEVLKSVLRGVSSISLTTDLWTSNQTLSYMCVVAHYIDDNWKIQTRVLGFLELDPPHTGIVIADALYACVTDWNIETKVMSITLDNASNNDGAIEALKAKLFYRRGMLVMTLKTNIFIAIKHAIDSDSEHYKQMGEDMLDKFDKYWEERTDYMVIATIFDPRYKMNYIEWAFGELYGKETARLRNEMSDVKKQLEALYDKCVAQDKRVGNGASSSSTTTSIHSIPVQAGYQSFLSARLTRVSKSELRNYLEDEVAAADTCLDILDWWKINALRYPIMAKIAKRFLAMPATSVSSESTFSTTGRILDAYQSSLKPVMVEALVCAASYIKGAHVDLNMVPRDENEEDDVETIKLPVVEEIND